MTRKSALALISVLFIFCLAGSALAGDVLYARYPALSPDGGMIAVTYLGDIWTVPSSGGQARRLTVHEAEDVRPHFSPDGKSILFSSRRYNNYDVYVVPVEGGEPGRLTFSSSTDYGTGWFPGSDSVLIYSYRDGWGDLFKISVEGGMPIKLTGYPYEDESAGRISADGRYLIYNNGSGSYRWWRRDLRGGRNTDVYIQDRTQKPFASTRLTAHPGYDLWPILNRESGEIYFVSNRDEWAQIWKMPVAGGEPVRLTNFTDDGVQWLNSNPQGTVLVFEQGFEIWIMDPTRAEPRKVSIEINSDEKINRTAKKTFDGSVDWFSLSPDEKKIAAVVHGEIFVLPASDPKEGKRITYTPAREAFPVWGADSKTIYYNSDRHGNYEIYSADVTTSEETRLTNSPEDDVKPIVSPDGKYLACFRANDRIVRIDLKTGDETVWVEGLFSDFPVAATVDYDWSPDSRWLTFAMNGPTYETDIFMVSIDDEMHNISKFARDNIRPRFSNDGKIVYFTSTINNSYDACKIDLVPKPAEFFESSFDSLFAEKEEAKEDEKKEESIDSVVVDPERIESRRK
ncbi:MAG: PD40 domain-containing protein, partial [Candidatus Zixiibacteriota bacterium]